MNTKQHKAIPNTSLVIGQRVYCEPLGEEGHIVGYENDGFILIIDLVKGGTAHVPAADCRAVRMNEANGPVVGDATKVFRQIARKHLNIDTLEIRHSDHLDFHQVSVWQLAKAMQAAYDAGRDEAKFSTTPRPRP